MLTLIATQTHCMKIRLLIVLFLTSFLALGADKPTISNVPPTEITWVSPGKDGRTLVIRYKFSGRSHEQNVTFPNQISEFRYCRWLGEQGIAVVASTRTEEFYYATIHLNGRDAPVWLARIPAPTGKNRLLGIANTGGDSIVITAVEHRRNGPDTRLYGNDRLSGWMFIDNCPPGGASLGLVIPFDIPAKESGEEK
jgi:hypothetical protein